jgi:hypothetical protein
LSSAVAARRAHCTAAYLAGRGSTAACHCALMKLQRLKWLTLGRTCPPCCPSSHERLQETRCSTAAAVFSPTQSAAAGGKHCYSNNCTCCQLSASASLGRVLQHSC